MVVGKLVKKALTPIWERLNEIDGLTIHLYGLASQYWGQEQVVTGLLTGQDLLTGLKGKDLGDQLLLPSVMLKHGESIFLDDITIEEVQNELQVPISVIFEPQDFVDKILGVNGNVK